MKLYKLLYTSLLVTFFLAAPVSSQTRTQKIKIATFNIQNFGQKKLSKMEITDTLAMIIRKFDIVAVQEISDAKNLTAGAFLNIINSKGKVYRMACSARTGMQIDDKTSQEQYVFYYNPGAVELVDTAMYDDSANDYFQREPWVAQFRRKADGLTFELCTIHTSPQRAVEEIAALIHVEEWIPTHFHHSENVIFCGDFNAGCDYASPEELRTLAIHQKPYLWLIHDDAKTNLSKNDCAYDRFVVTENLKPKLGVCTVFRFFKSKRVSDHWPVYMELR